MTASRRSIGLAARVQLGLGLIVLTGVATAWLVATLVAPPLFREHMRRAGPVMPQVTVHAEEAFRSANGISLVVALVAALLVSAVVSGYLTRRLGRSLRPVAQAAAQVARGRYDVRVTARGLGAEFDELTEAFNGMAAQLDQIEETRRRLLADLAHELRTPVATLGAYLEALQDGVASMDADTMAVMQAQTGRLARLSQDVAAVSRAEEGGRSLRRQVTAPADLVAAAVAAAEDRYAAKGVRLDRAVAVGLPDVDVDVDRFAQVLGNLLDNALRYTPASGTVTLAMDRRREWIRLRVIDTGSGIAAEHLPHVFERFYRADAARDRGHGGSGIGLAIVKAYVEAHGGQVRASSDGPERGSTFTVDIPPATGRPADHEGSMKYRR